MKRTQSRSKISGRPQFVPNVLMLVVLLVPSIVKTQHAQAQTLKVLHSFSGAPDGCKPQADLLRDGAGNLYGTAADCGTGNGIVFKISATGKETILHTFTGGTDGGTPGAGLIRDTLGNLYGTTYAGGASKDGVVFEILKGKAIVLHSFSGADGAHPTAALVRDKAGNLYGTTFYGGAQSCSCGTVFKIDTGGNESVLYSFSGGADGKFPAGRLLLDGAGNLYGTASEGGVLNCDNGIHSCGVVFKVTPAGQESVLYTFQGTTDGGEPMAGLVRDSAGNFYGTTFAAGNTSRPCALNAGCGTVFKLSRTGAFSVLYTFTNGVDGANPVADLVLDSAGNLYGTTKLGGASYGVVFEISGGSESTLYTFQGTNDGVGPLAGVIRDSSGNLYGTASFGGNSAEGTVFEIAP